MQMWKANRNRLVSGFLCVSAVLFVAFSAGCKKGPAHESAATPQGAVAVPTAGSQPNMPATVPASSPAATQPASGPASKPASRPASTFISKPPYPVELNVVSPEEEQPGWLRIVQFFDNKAVATCSGVFPEKNVIEVQTNNVQSLRMHIGYLPLADRKRIVLRIDGQAIELARKNRKFVHFERSKTGRWEVVKSED